jgi:excisionase family DNA binding protein
MAYLTVQQLSQLINRSPAAIRNLVLRKRIPFRKPGGRLLFLEREIREWVEMASGVRLEDLEETRDG